MAMWPFAKKKGERTEQMHPVHADSIGEAPVQGPHLEVNGPNSELDLDLDSPDPIHDAVSGVSGPFDADSVNIEDFDFSDFAQGVLNLGSVQIPLPIGSEVQVEMGETGPRMLHIVTQFGRITPVAFAAPKGAGQWRESTKKIAEDMRGDGLHVRIEEGPWGREVVGQASEATVRIIGVDGPRWMLRLTLMSPRDLASQMMELGREVTARTFVCRGDKPMMAGTSLPVALPDVLANQVKQAMVQRAEQAAAAKQQPQQPPQRGPVEQPQPAQHAPAAPVDPPLPPVPSPPRGPAASAFQQMKAEPR